MPDAVASTGEKPFGLRAGGVYLVTAVVFGLAAFGLNAWDERGRARPTAPPTPPQQTPTTTGSLPPATAGPSVAPAPALRPAQDETLSVAQPAVPSLHCPARPRMAEPATLGDAARTEPPPLAAVLLSPCLVMDQPDEIWTGARPPPRSLGSGPPATGLPSDGIALAAPVARDPRGERRIALEPPYLIVDGGSFRTATVTIRLAHLDALSAEQVCFDERDLPWACGLQSRAALHNATRLRPVTCDVLAWEGVDRATARCAVDGRDLSLHMIGVGFARPGAEDALMATAADEARIAQRGAWRGGFRLRVAPVAQPASLPSGGAPSR